MENRFDTLRQLVRKRLAELDSEAEVVTYDDLIEIQDAAIAELLETEGISEANDKTTGGCDA